MSTNVETSLDAVLARSVDSGDVPNIVAVAADRNGIIYEGSAGPRAVGSTDPVGPDSVFRLASMTKMITTAAALTLVDDGRLDLDAPVARYRPEFADLQVLERMDGDSPVLRAPATQATVRQLASHTSGLAYWFWNADILQWETATGTPNVLAGDERSFHAPLTADPGTKVVYGHSTDWLGRVIESISGRPLDEYLEEAVLAPLGMTSTSFRVRDDQRDQLVPIHVKVDGQWVATDIDWPTAPDWWAGGHALYSTPHDYLTFQRMLLDGGQFDGVRVLSEEIVGEAFSNQIGDLFMDEYIPTASPAHSADFPTGPGRKWGLGLMLNTLHEPGLRAAGSGAWAGLANTHFWIDRSSGVVGSIYSQFLPFVTPEILSVYEEFERGIYSMR